MILLRLRTLWSIKWTQQRLRQNREMSRRCGEIQKTKLVAKNDVVAFKNPVCLTSSCQCRRNRSPPVFRRRRPSRCRCWTPTSSWSSSKRFFWPRRRMWRWPVWPTELLQLPRSLASWQLTSCGADSTKWKAWPTCNSPMKIELCLVSFGSKKAIKICLDHVFLIFLELTREIVKKVFGQNRIYANEYLIFSVTQLFLAL